jgi:hypothetical protein
MGTKIIMVIVAVWIVAVVIGTNRARDRKPFDTGIQQNDRSDTKHPMSGIYSDSKCSVEEQMKGIYNCP